MKLLLLPGPQLTVTKASGCLPPLGLQGTQGPWQQLPEAEKRGKEASGEEIRCSPPPESLETSRWLLDVPRSVL